MLPAILLLVIGIIGMVAGLWLLFRKRQRMRGSLLLVADAAVFLVSLSWPTDIVGDGDAGDPPAPRVAPVYEEGS